MKGIIDWVVKHPTLVNLLMVAICVMGLVSINTIPKEVFPESALDMIIVRMAYRGAGPKEIENGILLKIEDATQSITGIAQISSEAKENIATVRIEVASNAKTARVLRDVKDQIDQISSFPVDAEKPAVYEVVRKTPVTSIALYGDVSRASLQTIAERIKDKLLEKAGIDDVVIDGKKEREISIEIQEAKLRKYNLQIADIGRALSRSNFDLSGGTLKTKKRTLSSVFTTKNTWPKTSKTSSSKHSQVAPLYAFAISRMPVRPSQTHHRLSFTMESVRC